MCYYYISLGKKLRSSRKGVKSRRRKFMEGEQEIPVHHLKRHDPFLISTSMLC
jgi:hypothetical protein